MSTTRKTAVGNFTLVSSDPESGHITVSLQGEPIHKVIGRVTDVLDGMNEVEGVYRNYDRPEFVITVERHFRSTLFMDRIFFDFIDGLRRSLRNDAGSTPASVATPDMARIIDELYSNN